MQYEYEPESEIHPFDSREFFICKDEITRWYLDIQMSRTYRTPAHNIITRFHMLRPKGEAKDSKTSTQSFLCIFSDEIIHETVTYCTYMFT